MARPPRAERHGNATWMNEGEREPMTVFPRVSGGEGEWYDDARRSIARYLPRFGSMLFRGFALDAHSEQRLLGALGAERTAAPAIAPWGHANAGVSLVRCVGAAGESSLVDLRELYRQLPGTTRARLVDRGLRLVQRLDVASWRALFGERTAVAAWCGRNASSFEWLAGDELRLTLRVPCVMHHEADGSLCWNARSLRYLGSDPRRTLQHADGSAIERRLRADIERTLARVRVVIAWEPDDLLVIDHALTGSLETCEWADLRGLAWTGVAVTEPPCGAKPGW